MVWCATMHKPGADAGFVRSMSADADVNNMLK